MTVLSLRFFKVAALACCGTSGSAVAIVRREQQSTVLMGRNNI